MKKLLAFWFILMLFSSCVRDPKEIMKTDNQSYDVELLFEVDGCKVYRFWDHGHKYFTTCNGSVSYKTNDKSSKIIPIQTIVK